MVLLDILPLTKVKLDEDEAWKRAFTQFTGEKLARAQVLTKLSVSMDIFADKLRCEAYQAITNFNAFCSPEDKQKFPSLMNLYTRKQHPFYAQLQHHISQINTNLETRNGANSSNNSA